MIDDSKGIIMAIRDIIDDQETHALYTTADDQLGMETKDLWQVLGFIVHPAVILRNMATGERITEVIGCANAERYHRLIRSED
jgi:hypothetical protein